MNIIIDQLRISDDALQMYINAHVNKHTSFSNVHIKSLTIKVADNVRETDPKSNTKNYIYKKEYAADTKEIYEIINIGDINSYYANHLTDKDASDNPLVVDYKRSDFSRTLFFIYIETDTVSSDPSIPCSENQKVNVYTTFDDTLLHQKSLDYIKGLANTCIVPVGFTDFILQWNAFKSAITTEHYVPAIDLFNKMFDIRNINDVGTKGCGCHG